MAEALTSVVSSRLCQVWVGCGIVGDNFDVGIFRGMVGGGGNMAGDRCGAGGCDPDAVDRAQASGGDARNGDSIARVERGGAAARAGAPAAEEAEA